MSAIVTVRSGSLGQVTLASVQDAPCAAPPGQFAEDEGLVTVSVPRGSALPPLSGVLVSDVLVSIVLVSVILLASAMLESPGVPASGTTPAPPASAAPEPPHATRTV